MRCTDLDIDVRWAGEPDVLLKLEPSSKWLLNAVKIGKSLHIWPHMLLQSPGALSTCYASSVPV